MTRNTGIMRNAGDRPPRFHGTALPFCLCGGVRPGLQAPARRPRSSAGGASAAGDSAAAISPALSIALCAVQNQLIAMLGDALEIGLIMPPVPAGIRRPTMTFSFSPSSISLLPFTAASVRTRVVSWNDAAEMKLRVCREALVMPSRTGLPVSASACRRLP